MAERISFSEAAKSDGAAKEVVDFRLVRRGILLTMEWRHKAIWIVHRTNQMLGLLGKQDNQLVAPQSCEPHEPEYAKTGREINRLVATVNRRFPPIKE